MIFKGNFQFTFYFIIHFCCCCWWLLSGHYYSWLFFNIKRIFTQLARFGKCIKKAQCQTDKASLAKMCPKTYQQPSQTLVRTYGTTQKKMALQKNHSNLDFHKKWGKQKTNEGFGK
jgi:hypothetical protein